MARYTPAVPSFPDEKARMHPHARPRLAYLLPCLLASLPLHATVFGRVTGVVHDAQHRPVSGATVLLRSGGSAYTLAATTDADGAFRFLAVPLQRAGAATRL